MQTYYHGCEMKLHANVYLHVLIYMTFTKYNLLYNKACPQFFYS